MRALVTGGAGFIGSGLVERLASEGHDVEVLDDLSTGLLGNLGPARELSRTGGGGRVRIHSAELGAELVPDLIARWSPDVVFHLAGPTRRDQRQPSRRAIVEIGGTVAVIDAAAAAGVGTVVCVAAARDQLHPTRGIPARAVQEYLGAYAETHGMSHRTVVLPTVYGPRQRTMTAGSVVAVFVERVLTGDPCVIHGDGTQSRDLVFVDDVVDAIVRAAVADAAPPVIEIGTGTQTEVAELHARVVRAVRPDDQPEVVSAPFRPDEPGAVVVDPGPAADALGWTAWTTLDEGLARVVDERRTTISREADDESAQRKRSSEG